MENSSALGGAEPPWPAKILPWAALILGLALAFGPIWSSGMLHVPGDRFDGRLVHFSLEHAHRFLIQQAPHESFWDPPIYYPARNVAAFTDTLLGFVPFYTPWRLLGASPNGAYQLWFLTVLTLTFWAGYGCLRRLFCLSIPAATVGTYLFTFASPRAVMFVHPQMLPWFCWALALLALGMLFAPPDGYQSTPTRRRGWIAVLTLSMAIQAWGAFYPFFFFVFLFALGTLFALATAGGRQKIFRLIAQEGPALALAAATGALLLAPLAQRYLMTAELIGTRSFDVILDLAPRPFTWVMPNVVSRFFHSVWELTWISGTPELFDKPFRGRGMGIVTPILAACGLYIHRSRRTVQLLVGLSLTLYLLTTLWPNGFTLWRWIFEYFPAASAIRSTGRFGLCLVVPAALGIGFFFQQRNIRRRPLLGFILFAVLVAEQSVFVNSHDPTPHQLRVDALTEQLGPECEAFHVTLYSRHYRSDALAENAMWAALSSGIPTLNGRYGNSPPDWHLWWKHYGGSRTLPQMDVNLKNWLQLHCVDPAKVCRLLVDDSGLQVSRWDWGPLPEGPLSCGS